APSTVRRWTTRAGAAQTDGPARRPVRDRVGIVGIMGVQRSWRSPDTVWIVDRVVDEPTVTYRIWRDGEPAGDVDGDLVALDGWLAAYRVDVGRLIPPADGDGDPFCE